MAFQVRATLDRELQAIQDNILRLANRLDEAISQSMKSLVDRDQALAEEIIANDREINQLRYDIEQHCLKVTATQQPTAGDLRNILGAMIIVNEMERMADHAAGIAKIVVKIGDEPPLKPLIDLPRMAETAREMLSGALKAYRDQDEDLAHAIAAKDDQIDSLYTQIFRELLTYMLEDPKTTNRALHLIFVAHNLERIADRVTNIVERVVFMGSGELLELNPEKDASGLE
jgi:phosphate transport system protein